LYSPASFELHNPWNFWQFLRDLQAVSYICVGYAPYDLCGGPRGTLRVICETVVGTSTGTTSTAAAPKSILKKSPSSGTMTTTTITTTTTTTRPQFIGGQRVASSGHSSAVSACGGVASVLGSRSMSSGSLRDSLEISKSHLQPSDRTHDPATDAMVCVAVVFVCRDRK